VFLSFHTANKQAPSCCHRKRARESKKRHAHRHGRRPSPRHCRRDAAYMPRPTWHCLMYMRRRLHIRILTCAAVRVRTSRSSRSAVLCLCPHSISPTGPKLVTKFPGPGKTLFGARLPSPSGTNHRFVLVALFTDPGRPNLPNRTPARSLPSRRNNKKKERRQAGPAFFFFALSNPPLIDCPGPPLKLGAQQKVSNVACPPLASHSSHKAFWATSRPSYYPEPVLGSSPPFCWVFSRNLSAPIFPSTHACQPSSPLSSLPPSPLLSSLHSIP